MPGREVHIHDAHRRIIQHITREGLALDRDSADRTPRPEESAHALPLLLLHIINENEGGRRSLKKVRIEFLGAFETREEMPLLFADTRDTAITPLLASGRCF